MHFDMWGHGGGGAAFGGAIFMENGISSITRVKMSANTCNRGAWLRNGDTLKLKRGGGGGSGMGGAVFQYSACWR
jgi:hypothetical protein